jgi:death-on-curing protein
MGAGDRKARFAVKYADVLFLTVDQVKQIHAIVTKQYGGPVGVLDEGLLESAVLRCQQTFDGVPLYPSLAAMAGALIFGVSKNHAFEDGNKRTALSAGVAFLAANNHPLPFDNAWEDRIVDVAKGTLTADQLLAFIAAAIGEIPIEA